MVGFDSTFVIQKAVGFITATKGKDAADEFAERCFGKDPGEVTDIAGDYMTLNEIDEVFFP